MKYIALGKDKYVSSEDVIAVFDLDITSQSYLTRKFLSASEKSGIVENAAEDIPKSFIVCYEKEKHSVYLSQMATATLAKRFDAEKNSKEVI